VAPGTVLPLAVTVVNETDMRQAIDVALDLSPELDLAGVEDDPQSADPVSWSLALAAGETRSLRFQVVIPDAPGSYSVEASVRADGRSLPGGPSLRLDVARSTNASLAETIDRLEAVDAAPGEGAHLGVALARLRLAASLPARSPWLELRIRLAAEAAEAIGRLASVDLRGERLAIGAILSAWERSAPDGR
jgi:hypothetical protein